MASPEILSEIRNRLDIVEIISQHVILKKAGRNLKGLCPFHQEKSPSFIVSPDKQIFHCFGCHEGGDLFGFVMKMEGLTFPEAIEKLAERAGVELANSSGPRISKEQKEALYQANRVAAWYYHETLKKSPEAEKARAYLQERGITEKEIEKFRLGYAPLHSELLTQFEQRKVSLDSAIEAGVLRRGDRGTYEGFKGRLTFPIFNRDGKVVGLGGRIIEKIDAAKYINSPDSPIYDKSAQLYGLLQAQEAIRQKKRVFLVEGYLDVIALHQYGFEEAVAPLGTALTLKQVSLIKRYTDEIIMLFDGDDAGWKATLRALELTLSQGISPKALIFPEGEDPDSFLRRFGAKKFAEKLKETRNLLGILIDKTLAQKKGDITEQAQALEELKPFLLKVESAFERNLYIRKFAEGLGVPETWVFEGLGLKAMPAVASPKIKVNEKIPRAEEMLLEIFLRFPERRAELVKSITPKDFTHTKFKFVAEKLWEMKELTSNVWENPFLDLELQKILSEIALKESPFENETLLTVLKDCIEKIKKTNLKNQLSEISIRIREAEAGQETEKMLELLKAKHSILGNLE